MDATADRGCYEETNIGSPESIMSAEEKINQLQKFIKKPRDIVSIGVGSGAELIALINLYKSTDIHIYGMDLSQKAINNVKLTLEERGLNASLILGSAIEKHFPNDSIDVFVESSLLHEIYSYVSEGKKAWKKAIEVISEQLAEGGIFLLRDFSSPESDKCVELTLTTDISIEFYRYFKKSYKRFEGWNKSDVDNIRDIEEIRYNEYPESVGNKIILNLSKAAEFLLHFKNFYQDYTNNTATLNDPKWKEINETYYIPNPYKQDFVPMPITEYVDAVLKTANDCLLDTPYKLICVQKETSQRIKTAEFLKNHFCLKAINTQTSEQELFNETTAKMELVFKKIRK